jgi:hypothetical protein
MIVEKVGRKTIYRPGPGRKKATGRPKKKPAEPKPAESDTETDAEKDTKNETESSPQEVE